MKLIGCLSGILVLMLMSCRSSSPDPSASGGSTSGGFAAGGRLTGGTNSGGVALGGASFGGSPAGGASFGGSPSGGAPSGAGAAGLGGSPAGAGGGAPSGRPSALPATDSKDDISAFLKSGGYKQSPWVSDVPAPREKGTFSQHPSKLRVWMNQTVLDSIRAQRDGMMGRPPLDQWSMLVKEMYDENGANLIGIAAALRTQPGKSRDGWTFFCYGPDSRCTSNATSDIDNPIYGNGDAANTRACMDCHGGLVLTPPPL